jgi:hypothetical protein
MWLSSAVLQIPASVGTELCQDQLTIAGTSRRPAAERPYFCHGSVYRKISKRSVDNQSINHKTARTPMQLV